MFFSKIDAVQVDKSKFLMNSSGFKSGKESAGLRLKENENF